MAFDRPIRQGTRKKMETDGVIVQCEGFRCLAYMDEKGRWRNLYDNSKLRGVIKIVERFDS